MRKYVRIFLDFWLLFKLNCHLHDFAVAKLSIQFPTTQDKHTNKPIYFSDISGMFAGPSLVVCLFFLVQFSVSRPIFE